MTPQQGHWTFDIEIYAKEDADDPQAWPQAQMLVHGYRDVLWTNDVDGAMSFLRESVEAILDEDQ